MDKNYMTIAMQLAQSVKGQTYPNPPVGAVIVKDGIIRGLGAHLQAGEPHAEVHAIRMAGKHAENSTLYVTLEPCSHIGKTNACADLIIEKGISRVVIATKDPHEKVAGKGIERLERAGIHVKVGVLKDEANHINDVFFHYIKNKQPFITLKSAISLDGKTATKTGESQWITGEAARKDVHFYRHTHDAILVGVNTILQDNPFLTTRIGSEGRHPKRIILDTNLKTPLSANVIQNNETETIIFISQDVKEKEISEFTQYEHVQIIQLQTETISVLDVVRILGEKEVASLYVEGGATINDSFLRAGLINQFILYIAPKLIGGEKAPTAIGGKGFKSINDLFSLKITDVKQIGEDIKLIAIPKGDS